MLGAILAKREVHKGFDALDRHDLETLMGMFHDDGVFEFPSDTIMGGRFEGKEAIRSWFERWYERIPKSQFTLRHISVENIFALGATNVAHAEWEVAETDHDGNTFHMTGVTAFEVVGGKARYVKDYIFDQDVLAQIWPSKAASGS
jgi:ketosteroid isomerase-like protein